MTIRSIQKVIKIGSSAGVTLPSKDLKYAGFNVGDEVEVIVRKKSDVASASTDEVLQAARQILSDYEQDFKNLANR